MRLFRPFAGSPFDIDDLTVQMGSMEVATYNADNPPMARRPIIRNGNKIVVATPSELASALVTQLVETAVRLGIGGRLAEKYHDAVWMRVRERLRLTQNRPINSAAILEPDFSAREVRPIYSGLRQGNLCRLSLGFTSRHRCRSLHQSVARSFSPLTSRDSDEP